MSPSAWPAATRAFGAIPPTTLAQLRADMNTETLVLRCVSEGCARCEEFEASERAAFEGERFRGNEGDIQRWDCTEEWRHALAYGAGVRSVPSYLVVAADGTTEVVTPP